ncbi:unnamed protein product [Auanema sp. JU1783]|nr:unnamed protein product [Auanema sp. JU1783]
MLLPLLFLILISVPSAFCSHKTTTVYAKKLKSDPPFCYEFIKVITEESIECNEKQIVCDERIELSEPKSINRDICLNDHRFAKYVDSKWNEIVNSKLAQTL